ncbi:bifunctional metallophosphatase/5'-nucleotidase [Ulvibacterium sp.]|uniref:bifunctional metallophosphatase/5'-nucleotidase n=1 Tax=Ulvibacterium sp. TaxID=2665914 RepID=UPI002616B9BF|nr:bifunctional metallophosphatase/5'-nucleotidase [Ulvibacterium sp.]
MRKNKLLLIAVVLTFFYGCYPDDYVGGGGKDDDGDPTGVDPDAQKALDEADFVLQLLHYADVDGNEETALDAVDEFSALVNGLTNDSDYGSQTLMVSSGDIIIPGSRFFAAEQSAVRAVTGSNEPGHADIAFANAVGVVASALGNHELDAGPGEFSDAIQAEAGGGAEFIGSAFPFLSANVDFTPDDDFSIGTDGSEANTMGTQVAKYAIATVNGQQIGLVGASTPTLPSITSTGSLIVSGEGGNMALAAEIQPAVDALKGAGVNKIVLLAHMQQIAIEKELATLLDGVDIIVAGGSNTRMGDNDDSLFSGDGGFQETYPFITKDASDNPTLVVNVDGDYKYLGRLVVGFDAHGVLDTNTLDEYLNGAYASIASVVSQVNGTPISTVTTLQNALNSVIDEQFSNVLGFSDVYLDGRRSQVRTQETNLGNLTADANLWYANLLSDEPVQISLKNGGGIRTEIGTAVLPPGSTDPNDVEFTAPENISEGNLRAVLRFDNGLVRLTVTAAELKDILEHAVAGSESGATPGQFPQVAGLSFTFDTAGMPRTAAGNGTRVSELTVGTDVVVSGGTIQGDASRTFNLVTLNFLANGGDSYPFTDADLSAPNRVNFYEGTGFGEEIDYPDANLGNDPGANSSFSYTGGEQEALAEYLISQFPQSSPYMEAETPASADTRIVQVNPIN